MAQEQVVGPTFNSYNFDASHEVPLSIDTAIYTIGPRDLPMLNGMGAEGRLLLPREPVNNKLYYWLKEVLPPARGTVGEDLDNSETAITMATGHGVRFSIGDVIRVDDEFMAITANASDVLTVTRGAFGSSATTHTTGVIAVGVGTVLAEGSVGTANFVGRDYDYNYTQIFSRKFGVSRTEQRIPKYGVASELARQMSLISYNLLTSVEQAMLYQQRYNDDTTMKRSTGGLISFVPTANKVTTEDWLTVDTISDQQQTVWDTGGEIDTIAFNPVAATALNNIMGNDRIQSVDIMDPRRGRMRAQVAVTEYGDVQLVRNRWLRPGEAFGFMRGNARMRVFDPLQVQPLGKTDDTDNFLMVMEVGFELVAPEHAVLWTGLDSSAALPTGLV